MPNPKETPDSLELPPPIPVAGPIVISISGIRAMRYKRSEPIDHLVSPLMEMIPPVNWNEVFPEMWLRMESPVPEILLTWSPNAVVFSLASDCAKRKLGIHHVRKRSARNGVFMQPPFCRANQTRR